MKKPFSKKAPVVYDPSKIESKWQKKWASSKIYLSKEDSKKPKYYVLDMFPYPSGEGLHVGHPKGYIATDVIARMKRMQGHNVLHPMGFDAFGLPAENYALKMKTHPEIATNKNVARYKEQLHMLGFDYDWSREVNTTDPAYYKWTQWIFLQMFKKGLAFESFEPINWCPSCKTGLANEDVENGRCERCGTPVEKKPLRQWVLKITDYADRLLKDLDTPAEIPMFTTTKGSDAFRPDMPINERNNVYCIIKHWKDDSYLCMKWKKNDWKGYIIGGIENGESVETTAVREVTEESGYKNVVFKKVLGKAVCRFYQELKNHNRVANVTVVSLELKDGERVNVSEDENFQDVEWVPREKVRDFVNREDLKYMWDLYTGAETQKDGLLLDWPASIVKLQKDWIGKSEGALIKFALKGKSEKIEVFTTRPDTLFGVTYVVLAPEHKLVAELLANISNKKEVEAYIARAKNETEIERTDATKEKTGVELKGIKAINPANNEEVPVWISDYVLADYGTGAVMAVPAHDERDFAFAKKFGLPVKQVVNEVTEDYTAMCAPKEGKKLVQRDSVVCVIKHWSEEKYLCLNWKNTNWHTPITGGIDAGETAEQTGSREIIEETGYKNFTLTGKGFNIIHHYYTPIKDQNRFENHLPLFYTLKNDEKAAVSSEENAKHDLVWISKDEVESFFNHDKENFDASVAIHSWHQLIKPQSVLGTGILMNSGKFDGKDSESVKKEITAAVGGNWVTKYKLRDWVFSRQRYWGEPIPLIHCEKCGVVAVPEKDLPVELPKVKTYEPTGTGESPLAAIEKWVNVKCPQCKGKGKRETNTMPQWAGSSWYYLRYTDAKNKKTLVNPSNERYWSPVDLYVGGAEHATRHLIYARFWHKFLYDIGVVSTIEPFIKLQHVGLIMGEGGRKMSKRFGNVVNPDDVVKTYGADTLRVYEMFMGPFDQQIAWSTSSMVGPRRFIERIWKLAEKVVTFKNSKSENVSAEAKNSSLANRILHKAIKKVTDDIENLRFNTAISTLMITVNELEKLADKSDTSSVVTRNQFEIILKLIAPFAPHVAEELWALLGNKKSIHISEWPTYKPELAVDSTTKVAVQVNGKVRAMLEISPETPENELKTAAMALPEVKKWTEGKEIRKVIIIKGRLISFVTS